MSHVRTRPLPRQRRFRTQALGLVAGLVGVTAIGWLIALVGWSRNGEYTLLAMQRVFTESTWMIAPHLLPLTRGMAGWGLFVVLISCLQWGANPYSAYQLARSQQITWLVAALMLAIWLGVSAFDWWSTYVGLLVEPWAQQLGTIGRALLALGFATGPEALLVAGGALLLVGWRQLWTTSSR